MQQFSFEQYKYLVVNALDHGYKVTSFEKYDCVLPKTLILRHDIDYTLNGVLEMAQIEKALDCTATYLFRVHADEYNLFSCTALALVQRLLDMGHEIGLHYEAMNVGRALGLEPQQLLKREKSVLESILGIEVRTCSEHREISSVIHKTPLFRDLYNPYAAGFSHYAMDPKYCKDMKYLSDSNANWREGDPSMHYGKHEKMQVLVHPDWWFKTDLLLKGPYVHPFGTDI